MVDMLKAIKELQDLQASCKHKNITCVWPRKGPPRMACFNCGYTRILTTTEQVTREREIREIFGKKGN